MLPTCFIPRDSSESPMEAHRVTPASTRYLRKVTRSFPGLSWSRRRAGVTPAPTSGLRWSDCGGGVVFLAFVLDPLVAHGADFEEGLGFFIEALAIHAVEGGFSQDAEYCPGPEIILVVKAVDGLKNFFRGEAGILDVRQLVAAL